MNASPLPHGYSSDFVASYPYVVRERSHGPNYQRSYLADPCLVPDGVKWTNSQRKALHIYLQAARGFAEKYDAVVVKIVPRTTPPQPKGEP